MNNEPTALYFLDHLFRQPERRQPTILGLGVHADRLGGVETICNESERTMTDPNDLAAARERLRRLNTVDSIGTYLSDCPMAEFIQDSIAVAKAYLAEHPADNETVLTEDWLRSVGFCCQGDPVVLGWIRSPNKEVSIQVKTSGQIDANGGRVPGSTRGDVRLIMKALGIKSKESHAD